MLVFQCVCLELALKFIVNGQILHKHYWKSTDVHFVSDKPGESTFASSTVAGIYISENRSQYAQSLRCKRFFSQDLMQFVRKCFKSFVVHLFNLYDVMSANLGVHRVVITD